MGAVKRFFTNWWTLAVLATLLVSLVLFFLCGPLVGALLPARWWAILFVWVVFGVVAAIRWFRKRSAEKALAAAMAGPADLEGEAIGGKMKAALDRAKAGGKGSLYASPWYVIIGPPGAGKTTLIQKSGLRLLNDEAAAGVGGTRNCDWWFADEAVLIDTAGRYTSQDSSAEADAKGWTSFLASLRKARPMQPLNGVIVAIGLDEIARVTSDALDRHIVAIRGRIAELGRDLGLELPVYVLFTKADLVAGFVEFFDDLSVEGRRSVVGHTLPLTSRRADRRRARRRLRRRRPGARRPVAGAAPGRDRSRAARRSADLPGALHRPARADRPPPRRRVRGGRGAGRNHRWSQRRAAARLLLHQRRPAGDAVRPAARRPRRDARHRHPRAAVEPAGVLRQQASVRCRHSRGGPRRAECGSAAARPDAQARRGDLSAGCSSCSSSSR